MKRNKIVEARTRSKVVVRHLPPCLRQSDLFSLIDPLFADRYSWTSFRSGKISSWKGQRCSRAYIDFKRPEDVLDFAGFFDGHSFFTEKGGQFQAIVEYAPSQQVPMPCPRDGREGTIYTDPDYLEFIKLIAKPVEKLQKHVVQLEAIEVEQTEEVHVVTPLMEFVRQKRNANGVKDVPVVQKTSRKTRKISRIRRGSCMTKHVQAKKKILPEDNKKDADGKHKTESGKELSGEKILLPKGKGVEVPEGGFSSNANSTVLIDLKQQNLHKSREKLIKSILSSNEAHSSSTCVLPKKTNPRILDIRKQLHLDTDLKSSVTCHALEYVEKNANKQSVSKELCATGNHGEKPAANEQVISVRSRSRTGENGPKRYFDLCETCHNINNKHYRREGNDVTNNSYVKSSKKAVNERKVWVQKSSSDSGK